MRKLQLVASFTTFFVMVLVAAIPTAMADSHTITKGDQGPNASAVTWEYVPSDYCIWTGHIVNNGLIWVVVDVYDNSTGMLVQVMHQRIRFAAYDAFPTGTVDTNGVTMAKGHPYEIVVTPNGPKGSSCTVEGPFEMPVLVAEFTYTVSGTTVSVDASASTSEVGIVSYAWNFDNMVIASGVTHSHIYVSPGTYTVTLTVTDMLGRTDSSSQTIIVSSGLPPDSYWYTVWGTTYASDGLTPLAGCALTITNDRTGETMIRIESDGTGLYICDVTCLTVNYGDSLLVRATGPSGQTGSATGVVDNSMPYLVIDVLLS
jgi:PKD repeat protein